jgi:hypothetical protein
MVAQALKVKGLLVHNVKTALAKME